MPILSKNEHATYLFRMMNNLRVEEKWFPDYWVMSALFILHLHKIIIIVDILMWNSLQMSFFDRYFMKKRILMCHIHKKYFIHSWLCINEYIILIPSFTSIFNSASLTCRHSRNHEVYTLVSRGPWNSRMRKPLAPPPSFNNFKCLRHSTVNGLLSDAFTSVYRWDIIRY